MMQRIYRMVQVIVLSTLFTFFVGARWSKVSGVSAEVVLSGSMQPIIAPGSLIVIRKEDVYQIGDIVTYRAGSSDQLLVTHRIIARSEEGGGGVEQFETKGDANTNGDLARVSLSQIQGRVIGIVPGIGFLYQYEKTRIGFFITVLFTFFFLVLAEFYLVLRVCESGFSTLRSYLFSLRKHS